jgi:hypothetical protein
VKPDNWTAPNPEPEPPELPEKLPHKITIPFPAALT